MKYYYENEQMLFIMTDVKSDKWLTNRRSHCPRSDSFSPDCFVPSPIVFYHRTGIEKSKLSLWNELASLASIKNETNKYLHRRSFQAYRDLLRCVIPSHRLLWLNMDSLNDSKLFWDQLIDFMSLNVSIHKRVELINSGIPYVGKKGCFIGDKPCRYEGAVNLKVNGGEWTSAIIPSVCVN